MIYCGELHVLVSSHILFFFGTRLYSLIVPNTQRVKAIKGKFTINITAVPNSYDLTIYVENLTGVYFANTVSVQLSKLGSEVI